MHELAADVKILVDYEHGRAEVARPHRGMEPDTA
jgi:hypothetical protein